MQVLKEIFNIIQSEHLERESILSNEDMNDDSLQGQLLRGIINGKFSTDREAASELYGKFYSKHSFQLLKSRLKQQALATLLLYDVKTIDRNPREAISHQLQRQLVEVNLMLQFGARSTAVTLLKRILATAIRYSLTGLSLRAELLMRDHYWYIGDKKMFKQSSQHITHLLELVSMENQAEQIYQELTIGFGKSRAQDIIQQKEINIAINKIKTLRKSVKDSYVIRTNNYKLNILQFQVTANHSKVIEECDSALHFFAAHTNLRNTSLTINLLMNKCEAYFLLRNFNEVLETLQTLRMIMPEKHPDRITVARLAFITYLQLEDYDEAEKIITHVFQAATLNPFFVVHQDEWHIFKMYLEIVRYASQPNNTAISEDTKIAKIRAMILPTFSKDKHGLNISLFTCDVIRQILLKDFFALAQLEKSIDNYVFRYLAGNKHHKRDAAFLRLLKLIIQEDLNEKNILRKSERYLSEIRSNTSQIAFVEIIPYERLWTMILDVL